jgi:hypothetical protein
MKLYKLTDQFFETKNHTLWGEGITHEAAEGDGKLCSKYWLHAYTDPILAIMMNPTHANIKNPILWEAKGEIGISDGTKVGCKKLTTIKQIPLPEINTVQKVAFGILCAKQVCKNVKWNIWADRWLDGSDRTKKSAYAYAATATAAATAAYAYAAAAYAAAAYAAKAQTVIDFIALAHAAMEIK